jgi:hypothetical protein
MQNVRSFINKFLKSPALQLTGVALAGLFIYIYAFLLPINLFELYYKPRLDLTLLLYQGRPTYVRLVLAFIGAWVLYWLGYRISFKVQKRSGWIIVILGMLAMMAVFLFVAPFDAADIYDNIMHGRILGVYGANPFQSLIANYPNDPFYGYPAWKNAVSAYGPLWESLAGLTARIAGDHIIANVLAFKILPGIFYLGSVVLVVLYLKREAPEYALSGAYLLGWNPMLLYETWGNGHNDIAMAFWFLAAAWFIARRRYTLAILSLLAGALIKFIPILLVPAVLLIGWRSLESFRARFIFLAKTAVISLFITVALYYPFWNGFAAFSLGRRMQMFATSIPAVIFRFLTPAIGLNESARFVSLVALGLLAVFVLIQSFRVDLENPARGFIQITFNILVFYLMVTCLWFQQWYSVWLLCLVPLLSEQSRRFALLFGFWIISKQLIFGPHFVPIIYFKPQTGIRLEPIYVLTVFGVPWLYALWMLVSQRISEKNYAAK